MLVIQSLGRLFGYEMILCCGLMFFAWVLSVRLDNYGIVDVAWSYGFTMAAFLALILTLNWSERTFLLAGTIALWSLRLGSFLLKRVARHHPEEDGRYKKLREDFNDCLKFKFFLFFQLQAASIALLSAPLLISCLNRRSELSAVEWAGVLLSLGALGGEALADRQMSRFKQNPSHRSRTCQAGLWRYSRHPNYFFESLIWWGYFLFALGSPWGWLSLYCPLLMTFLLLKVTGVPLAEAQALKSRGEEYRDYQRRTSVFVPWFTR